MTAKDYLRQMSHLLKMRAKEYDKNKFSARYWEINEQYLLAKAKRGVALKNGS